MQAPDQRVYGRSSSTLASPIISADLHFLPDLWADNHDYVKLRSIRQIMAAVF